MTRLLTKRLGTLRRLVRPGAVNAFLLLDRLGMHVHPKRYYSSVPDYAWLRAHPELWRGPAPLAGLHWDLDEQLRWLARTCGSHYDEVAGLRRFHALAAGGYGAGYGEIESQVLHCFVRSERPPRIVEVGGGISTAIMADAVRLNAEDGRATSILTIEPYPQPALLTLPGVTVLREFAQAAARSAFEELQRGDLLFIDSTHVVKTGSELARLYLDVVPALPPGVVVHVHDITLPYLYNRDLGRSFFDWQETTLVLGLLIGNAALSVLCCLSALHYDRRSRMREVLADYDPQDDEEGLRAQAGSGRHFPSSLWLVTK